MVSTYKAFVVYDISKHVFPTAPSPTTTHLTFRKILILINSLTNDNRRSLCSDIHISRRRRRRKENERNMHRYKYIEI
jgi:hypothetical protein